jgi:hypothetical protein
MTETRTVDTGTPSPGGAALPALLDDLSLEITGNQAGDLASAAAMLPLGLRIHVTYLAGEDLAGSGRKANSSVFSATYVMSEPAAACSRWPVTPPSRRARLRIPSR